MNADKMFSELGFIKYLDNEDTLIYKKEGETIRTSLHFDKRNFKHTFYGTDELWNPKDEGWSTQKFKNEWDKYCSAQGYWSSSWHEFGMRELAAINRKVEELRLE